MKQPILQLAMFLALFGGIAQAQHAEESSHDKPTAGIPDGKGTTLGLYVTAEQALAKWEADPEHVKLIDVRTPEEYCFVGHPTMAWNVPLKFVTKTWDPETKRPVMPPNPDFIARVKAVVKPGDTVLLTCRSGHRSAAAVNMLAEAGLKNVYTIVDGFEGEKVADPASPNHGKREVNGWKNALLPWTYDLDPELIWHPPEDRLDEIRVALDL